MRAPAIAALILGAVAAPGICQTAPLYQVDASASVTWSGTSHDEVSRYGGAWVGSATGNLGAGYYWTEHLKTEFEAGWSNESGPVYGDETLATPPFASIYTRHYFRTFRLSLGQTYQFGRNEWVHPFVGAGIDLDRERHRLERPAQTVLVDSTTRRMISVPALNGIETEDYFRPFIKGGIKAYLSERSFFLTDLKFDVRHGIEQVGWKAGIGFDF
jgi:hypothetical protein